VPAVGATTTATFVNASWTTVGEMIYVTGAGTGGQAGVLQVTAIAGNQLTLLNPVPPPAIPPASSSTTGLLNQLSGNTTDFVDGTNTCQNLVSAIQPTIWSARLRSFNAIGNPTFEVDQRNIGNIQPNWASGTPIIDRWTINKTGTMTISAGQLAAPTPLPTVPGTGYVISRSCGRIYISTAQASLAAGDNITMNQRVEGPQWRELQGDVHSISILCRSSIAGQIFTMGLRDTGGTRSLVLLGTIPTANQWTLVNFQNLPLWDSGGGWTNAPGSQAYYINVCVACGSTLTAPSAGIWVSGNYVAAPGMTNFAATLNSTFDVAFVQHEPGPLCSTPIDCPFTQNYDDCLRYYTKSYLYTIAPGAVNAAGLIYAYVAASLSPYVNIPFKKVMAKAPTVQGYSPTSGAAGTVRDYNASLDKTITNPANTGDASFQGFTITSPNVAAWQAGIHWTADTGW
jgi:hypothetical protein